LSSFLHFHDSVSTFSSVGKARKVNKATKFASVQLTKE
jgi:hypothetical protein